MSLLALTDLSTKERQRLGLSEVSRQGHRQSGPPPDFLTPHAPAAEPCPWWQRRYSDHKLAEAADAADAAEPAGAVDKPTPNGSVLTRKPMAVG